MWEMLSNTNSLHSKIKKLEADFPGKFRANGISRCGHCNGTGLNSNNLEVACKHCNGVGYRGFKELEDMTICPDCNASGYRLKYNNDVDACPTCEGDGRLDWIQAIQKGVKLSEIW